MKALVTGGSGFFGALLAELLRAKGLEVLIFDLNDNPDRPKDLEFIGGDIRDRQALRKACSGMDIVFHCVAQVPLAKDDGLFWSVNRDGTENMLIEAAASGLKKVVYISSSAVFGRPKSNPVTEDTPPAPGEAYGRAKLAGEDLCRRYAQNLDITIIRPRTILGHGRLGIFQILFEWVLQGSNIPVLGTGDNVYQLVHAADLAEACFLAASRPGPALYHCGTDRFGSMRQLLESLCAHAKTGSQVKSVPKAPTVALMGLTSRLGLSPLGAYHGLMYGESLYFDLTKVTGELGWRPKYSNEEMLCESYDWYLSNRQAVLADSGSSAHRSRVKPGILSLVGRLL